MPVMCTFKLNGQKSSVLVCPGIGTFPAFSGMPPYTDDPKSTGVAKIGPLPTGRYYIFDRGQGGIGSHIKSTFLKYTYYYGAHGADRSTWFSLFRDDGKIDDETFVNGVKRNLIRLHPIGPLGISEGCLTLFRQDDFNKLSAALHKQGPNYPTKAGMSYGWVDVTQ